MREKSTEAFVRHRRSRWKGIEKARNETKMSVQARKCKIGQVIADYVKLKEV